MKWLVLTATILTTGCAGLNGNFCDLAERHTFERPELLTDEEARRELAHNMLVERCSA